jgi:hypothetical protein
VGNDNRHLRAVLALGEDLSRFVIVGVKRDLRRADELRLAFGEIVAVDRWRRRVAGERVKRFLVVLIAAETACGADAGELHVAEGIAGRREELDPRGDVFQILQD